MNHYNKDDKDIDSPQYKDTVHTISYPKIYEMMNEYEMLTDIKKRAEYMNILTSWYMRQKGLLEYKRQ
jgi:hypothetical protein